MSNQDQIDYWNGEASSKWVTHADDLDGMLAPFIAAVLDEARPVAGEHVLDIGCGGGALSLAASARMDGSGTVTGIDVSRPLLDLAKARAHSAPGIQRFEEADASAYRAEQPVDCAVSRFGVMFFDDPEAAFGSLRTSLRPEGRMVFACWQAPEKNEWATLPLQIAMPLLPAPPERPPEGAPGPFAFADADRVRRILGAGGWKGIDIKPWQGELALPGKSAEDTTAFMLELGPLSRLLSDAGDVLETVRGRLTETLTSRQSSDGAVKLGAAAWIVSATAS
ncbi:MAG: class I SAM-dependent methyltransferase [Pseudomonadota bacterium]